MAWTTLVIAGVLEIVWAVGLKYAEGWSRPVPTVVTLAALVGSFVLLAEAMKSLPAGTAYAVWTGIGASGTAVLGMLLLGEPASPARLASLALVVLGIAGLKLAG
ncbi:MAG: quaternary ammonium compound efflux SMR transporter SugE [Vicinamibacterales bacterium]